MRQKLSNMIQNKNNLTTMKLNEKVKIETFKESEVFAWRIPKGD